MTTNNDIENVLNALEKKAASYLDAYGSCAQSSLLALQEQFGMGNMMTVRAATVMPGIALRGDICGAVIGGLMAIGLALGRDKPEDVDGYKRALIPARLFCKLFEKKFDGIDCKEVQQSLFGRSFDLSKPEGIKEFMQANSANKCHIPVGLAVRIAGRIILENKPQP